MNKKYFIDIVNKFIYGGIYEPPADINWFEIKHLAEIHNMGGIIGVVINRSNIDMPLECYEYFDFSVFDCARMGIMWEMIYNDITEILSQAKIPHIIVKGYVLRNLYTEKDMRTMGDLDFVVAFENLEKAMNPIVNKGFKLKSVFKGDWAYEKDGMTVELHPGLMDADVGLIDYEKYMSDIFNKTKLIKGCSYELTNEFHFIYIIMHIMKHFYGDGCGIRMILDMALFLNRYNDKLDWNYINKELADLKIDIFANNMFALCHRLFNSKIDKEIDEDLFEPVFDYIMEGGTFGFARKNYAVSQSRNRIAKKQNLFGLLLLRAFPNDEKMRGLVLWYRNKSVLLLPAAWIYRWIHSAFIKRGQLIKSVMATVETKESKKQLELLTKLGLYRK